MKLKEIPGLAEAVAQENFLRDAAFLPVCETIAGIRVLPLSFFHLNCLRVIRSPFLAGGPRNAHHIGAFLWIVSPGYSPAKKFRRWRYLRALRHHAATSLVTGIRDYIAEAFSDVPGGGTGSGISYYSTAAATVDLLASQYGWSEQTILHLPVKRGWQYTKAILRRLNPSAPQSNPSQAHVTRWLDHRAARQ